VFLDLLFALRARKVPVSTHEWMALARGLELGLHGSTLDGCYDLARTVLIKDVAHYDAFDDAWLATFKGVEGQALAIARHLVDWLADPQHRARLSAEDLAAMQRLSLDELEALYAQRLAEQKERHDGGNRWIGTGGTSPLGSGGQHPSGLRIGEGGGRSAMAVAGERRFREYRKDVVLDVRQIDVALRLLRDLGRDGALAELDLDATIDRTAKNAGDLEVVMAPPRRNRMKVVLLMDVGGSMDPHANLVERLFTAASRNGRFSRFRHYYFHNCVYDAVYQDAQFYQPVPVAELLADSDRSERLVIVGDAAMHPGELMEAGGAMTWSFRNRTPGLEWMRRLREHFRSAAWLNPDPEPYWRNYTVQVLRGLYPMFPLTLEGLSGAVRHLTRGGGASLAG
jgi:uncharacterized protein with von Willebrand factor type A (vWA) domain